LYLRHPLGGEEETSKKSSFTETKLLQRKILEMEFIERCE